MIKIDDGDTLFKYLGIERNFNMPFNSLEKLIYPQGSD